MSSVSGTGAAQAAPQAAATSSGQAPGAIGQDAFLKLLVTQLKNQDPLKPMDNSQMITQLAQFSNLSASEQTAQGVQELVSLFKQMAAGGAVSGSGQ